ncbi:uncharacterized protein LOC143429224 [Xylocopa sonorina]|uniref:uncharacterized protein LOC143429224 n=1 Tax=Xylocopa sonorina TaxID=1818115 RepID=UPI00403AFCB3
MKSTAFLLLFLLVGALAISKRSDDDNGNQSTVTASITTRGRIGTTTSSELSKECAESSTDVLIQLAETLGTAINLLLKPIVQLLGFSSVRELLVFLVNVVTDLLDAVVKISASTLLTSDNPQQVVQAYPSLVTLIGLLVNVLRIPLGLVGTLLAVVLALLSALL